MKLTIEPSTPLMPSFSVEVESTETIRQLLKTIAKKTGVPRAYLVLWKTLPALSETKATTFRSEKFRIDYQVTPECPLHVPEPVDIYDIPARIKYQEEQLRQIEKCRRKWQQQTLEQVGVKNGDILQLAVRPLRGDHIHYVVAFYVDQEFFVNGTKQNRSVPLNFTATLPAHSSAKDGKKCKESSSSSSSFSSCTSAVEKSKHKEKKGEKKERKITKIETKEEKKEERKIIKIETKEVGPKPLSILLDREPISFIYEGRHIKQVFPHFGLHGGKEENWFSMGLSHLHPGTSWQWFHETEGLGCNIDAFLEQVNTWIWERNSQRYPSHGPLSPIITGDVVIDFPLEAQFRDGRKLLSHFAERQSQGIGDPPVPGNGPFAWNTAEYAENRILIGNTAEKHWKMYYYSNFVDNEPSIVTEHNFGRTWLGENLGLIIFSYERRDKREQPDRSLILDRILYMANIVTKAQVPHLYQPYIDETDIATRQSMDNIPWNESSALILGFDGTYYPGENYRPLEVWKKSWLWPYIFGPKSKTERTKILKLDL